MERVRRTSGTPVIIVSGHDGARDMQKAFELGAADCLMKPLLPAELAARTRTVLKRHDAARVKDSPEPFVLGDLAINYAQRAVSVARKPVKLTATEYLLIAELSAAAGRVLTHDQLLRNVWGLLYSGDPRTVRTHIKTLRGKLGDDAGNPLYILTETGMGYRMASPGQSRLNRGGLSTGSLPASQPGAVCPGCPLSGWSRF